MKTKHATLSLEDLVTVTGGALPWGAIGNAVRRLLPNGPTMPLGPFVPPKTDGRTIA